MRSVVVGAYKRVAQTADYKLSDATIQQLPAVQSALAKWSGASGQCRVVYSPRVDIDQVAIVGIGDANTDNHNADQRIDAVRRAAAIGVLAVSGDRKQAHQIKVSAMGNAQAASEGAHLAVHQFTMKSSPVKPEELQLSQLDADSENWHAGLLYADAQNLARKLMETPANYMTPTIFAQEAVYQLQGIDNVEIKVHDLEWVRQQKMGAFMAVAQGSKEPLCLVEIHYKPKVVTNKEHIALVGKGVTFDTGGISIKPSANMHLMKGDMGGAAVVLATIRAAAQLKLPMQLSAVIPLCENMPSGGAFKPGDVVTAMNGKTIENLNSDAEGRLLLADAVWYAVSQLKATQVMDVATLTGAMSVALGEAMTGVFSNNDDLFVELDRAGKQAGDLMWRMPLHAQYVKNIQSKIADVKNVGAGGGGACTAAAFIQQFLAPASAQAGGEEESVPQQVKWAHLDIAGVMHQSQSDGGYNLAGMSGRPTRTLIRYLANLNK